MKPKVNVLMATYNGEKYLRRQLDSLLAQTYDNIDIYVRDDGSKDHTVELLKEYETKKVSVLSYYKHRERIYVVLLVFMK